MNVNQTRYSQNFTYVNQTPSGNGSALLDIQSTAIEYTVGYVVHTPKQYFGVQPFASVGAGSEEFRPTKGGGENATTQARAAYYYNLGAESLVYGNHFGLRASFRQVFALAPDFQQSYLRDHQHAVTSEPTVGFFLRF